MNFFAVFLQKLEPSCEIGGFRIENIRHWRFLCHSIVRYSRLSLQRGVERR